MLLPATPPSSNTDRAPPFPLQECKQLLQKNKTKLTLTCPALTPPLLFYNAGGVLNCFAPSFNSAKLILRSEKDRMAASRR